MSNPKETVVKPEKENIPTLGDFLRNAGYSCIISAEINPKNKGEK
jgi:hypothetical protein